MIDPRRRSLIRAGAALSLGAGAAVLAGGDARAQSAGFKALVCVFLRGGNDGLNMIPPADTAGHARYAAVRQGVAIARDQLVALDGLHGLHPALADLAPIWAEGKLAPVFNVGPLSRPLTLADYKAWRDDSDASKVPDKLFSHSDQQILWESAGTETVQLRGGWGGRLMEAVGGGQQAVSFGGASRFGSGVTMPELVLPGPGSQLDLQGIGSDAIGSARRAALMSLLGQPGVQTLHARYAGHQRDAIAKGSALGPVLSQAPRDGSPDVDNPDLSAAFGHLSGRFATGISRQLYQVAKMIRHRAALGGNRHLYLVSMGGFDHHGEQLGQHAALMGQLGAAIGAFWQSLKASAATDSVTLFTESDFGRTFKPNASGGTDHGWANQHLVIGGQVNGGRSHGQYPSLVVGGPDDAAANAWEEQGRWIPSISVAQYASTLIDWFAPGTDKTSILPTLASFPPSSRNVGFMTV